MVINQACDRNCIRRRWKCWQLGSVPMASPITARPSRSRDCCNVPNATSRNMLGKRPAGHGCSTVCTKAMTPPMSTANSWIACACGRSARARMVGNPGPPELVVAAACAGRAVYPRGLTRSARRRDEPRPGLGQPARCPLVCERTRPRGPRGPVAPGPGAVGRGRSGARTRPGRGCGRGTPAADRRLPGTTRREAQPPIARRRRAAWCGGDRRHRHGART